MNQAITHVASALGLMVMALPYVALEAAPHPDIAAQQRPQTRVVQPVRPIPQRQTPPPCVRVVPNLTAGSQSAASGERPGSSEFGKKRSTCESPAGTVVGQREGRDTVSVLAGRHLA